jgi:hypothetical protein
MTLGMLYQLRGTGELVLAATAERFENSLMTSKTPAR